MVKKARGRPKVRLGQFKMFQVKQLLPADGSPIQAKDLKEKAKKEKISGNTLFHYLDILGKHSLVLKDADLSFKPPRVYYKLSPEEVSSEIKEMEGILSKIYPPIGRTWFKAKQVPFEMTEPLRKSVFENCLALLFTYLLRIGARARTIEDERKREEFISIVLNINFYPYLLMVSSLVDFKPEYWIDALEIVKEMRQKSGKMFSDEIKRILPTNLSTLYFELQDDLHQRRMKEFEEKSKKFFKLLRAR